MSLTLIRKHQVRTLQSLLEDGVPLATAKDDVDQLAGDDIVLAVGQAASIKDLTVAADTSGAALIGITGVGAFSNVRAAAIDAYIGGHCIGLFASLAAVTAASSANQGKVAIVYGSATVGEDGIYENLSGSAWTFSGAILKRIGTSGDYAYDLQGVRLTNPGTTQSGSDVPNRSYIDAAISGYHWLDPVKYKANVVVAGTLPTFSNYESGSYAFDTTAGGGNGTLYVQDGAQWTVVAPVDGELLMLNGGSLGIPTEVEVDKVLYFLTAQQGWDYDNSTAGNRTLIPVESVQHTPLDHEARIYIKTNETFTYNNTQWVLSDSSGGTVGTRQYTEDNNVADGQTVTTSIDAIDMAIGNRTTGVTNLIVTQNTRIVAMIEALNQLGSTGAGKGASLVKIQDASGNYTSDNVEGALIEIAGSISALGAAPVKGTFAYREGQGASALGIVSFANNTPTVTIDATTFPNLQNFFDSTSRSFGTGGAGDYTARRLALAAGFDIQVELNGKLEPPIQIVYTNGGSLVITIDGTFKASDLVCVNLVRNSY